MIGNRTLFVDLDLTVKVPSVMLVDGSFVTAAGVGEVHLTDTLILRGVVYLSAFAMNLINVSQFRY